MNVITALAVWLAATVVVIAIAGTRSGSRIAIFTWALLLPLPAMVTGSPVARVAVSFLVVALFVAVVDFAFGSRPSTFQSRAAYMVGLFFLADTTRITVSRKRFDTLGATQILCALVAGGVMIFLWSRVEALHPTARYIARSIFAAVIVLAVAELMTGLVRLVSTALGRSLPPVHDAPYLSRTLSEFWNRRWNLVMGRWLKRHCFSPLKQRGVWIAVMGTFTASAALHAYFFVSVDGLIALSWAAFFMVQPLMLLAERKLHVRHWPVPLSHIWTITVLVALLPLLLRPFLFIFHTSL